MLFADLGFYPEGFERDFRKEVERAAVAVQEEVRHGLGGIPAIQAPFGKLSIFLTRDRSNAPYVVLGICLAALRLNEDAFIGAAFPKRQLLLIDMLLVALADVRDAIGWSSDPLEALVASLRTKDDLGWIPLPRFDRLDRRTSRTFRTVFDVTDPDGWRFHVLVISPDGVVERQQEVASEATSEWALPEWGFPVRSAIIRDRRYILRDRERVELASVNID